MGKSTCFTPVRGRAIRVTRLDGCGRPIYGAESTAVSKGIVTVSFTANTDDGEEINVPNFAGETCAYEPAVSRFLGYSVEIEFCRVDPGLISLLTGQAVVVNPETGNYDGFRVNSDVSALDSAFALELWTGTPGVQCAEDSAGGVAGGYLLLPYLQGGIFGDFTVENAEVTFTVTGASTKTGSGWGTGPYSVVPGIGGGAAPLSTPILSGDHLHTQFTDVAPPTDFCGIQPLVDPTDTPVSSVTVDDVDGLTVEFSAAPTGSGEPAWYLTSDGQWDWDENGEFVHTFDAPGTYTITVFRGGASAETQVTVPSGS